MTAERIRALDLIRGVAVLGILAINIAGFAGPTVATLTPNLPNPGSFADEAAFATGLVLFEGKMRGLFSILFGASMLLFLERSDSDRQIVRLGLLLGFGYLHFALLWWGDILFTYALAGLIAMGFRRIPPRWMIGVALVLFTAWQVNGMADKIEPIRTELAASDGTASLAQTEELALTDLAYRRQAASELAEYRSGFGAQIAAKLTQRPDYPLRVAVLSMGETLPLLFIGMALYRIGFFGGGWSRRALGGLAILGIGIGGAMTLAFAAWAWRHQFPPTIMREAISYALGFPHLLMALGYAASLMLAAPWLLSTELGRRIEAAGRMAFSNYLGTSLAMCGIFYGWGLGLVGTVPHAIQPLFVLLGWALMLAWSKPWLGRFRQGPLEWLWRSLTEGRRAPFRR